MKKKKKRIRKKRDTGKDKLERGSELPGGPVKRVEERLNCHDPCAPLYTIECFPLSRMKLLLCVSWGRREYDEESRPLDSNQPMNCFG